MTNANELTLFDFNGNNIRVIDMDGEPWFPAKDVCDALGIAKARNAVAPLNAEQARQISKTEISNAGNSGVSWPNRGMACVSKKGLYKLLFWSRKPAALDFQDWVTDVVLPAIEKDGMYVRGEENVETEEDVMALSLRAMEGLQKKLKEKTEELNIVSERVAEVSRTIAHVAGQMPGVNKMQAKADLLKAGYLHRQYGQYRVRSQYRDILFAERLSKHGGAYRCEIVVLPKGEQKLAEMRRKGQLTMKAAWLKANAA